MNTSQEIVNSHRAGIGMGLLAVLTLLTGYTAACQTHETGTAAREEMLPYVLEDPLFSARLPRALKEISGLTTIDSAHVAAVQDEDGVVYVIDAVEGKLVSEHPFGSRGDYEALEAVGDRMYVLRSDGVLFELSAWRSAAETSMVRYKTSLSARNDTEGLALATGGSHLLVACKEYPGKGFRGKRAIYRFSLSSGQLHPRPVIVLDAEAAERDLPEGAVSRSIRRLLNIRRFKPSGLAVHPLTGDIYVVSSVSSSLTVFDGSGTLRWVGQLNADLLPQPEGITFLPDGDMILSSEGKGGRAVLTRYKYHPPE